MKAALKGVLRWLRPEPPKIRVHAIPVTYRGISFRSTLEADWAVTFDYHGITWSYEPIAVRLSDGQVYRCDFYLPIQNVWCEAKGPHDLRIDKTYRFATDLAFDEFDVKRPLVVILRPPLMGAATVEGAMEGAYGGADIGIVECSRCGHFTFIDFNGTWECRVCGFWEKRLSGCSDAAFVRHHDRALWDVGRGYA